MKIVYAICGAYWLGYGIAAWCGYTPPNFAIGCGFLVAALGCFGSMFNDF